MNVRCPGCGKAYSLDSSQLTGRKNPRLQCRTCSTVFGADGALNQQERCDSCCQDSHCTLPFSIRWRLLDETIKHIGHHALHTWVRTLRLSGLMGRQNVAWGR